MRRVALALTTAIVMFGALGAPTRAADNLVLSAVLSRFSDYLESLRTQAGIPGLAVGLVSATDVVWEHGFGYQDVERSIATRIDAPFAVDGLTQTVVAALTLRCSAERGSTFSIDDPASKYAPNSIDPTATLGMLMTHTSRAAGGLVFSYRMDRLAALAPADAMCTDSTFRAGILGPAPLGLFSRFAMIESVPGTDIGNLKAGDEGFDQPTLDRFADLLTRTAVPYTVDGKGKATAAPAPPTPLTPAGGLLMSVRDLERFDLALKSGAMVPPDTLAAAWTAPVGANGQPLPHGQGWFVQAYNGEPIVWQYGEGAASSSMMIAAPRRGLTLILLANSAGLVRSMNLAAGDVTVSPFARVFFGIFLR